MHQWRENPCNSGYPCRESRKGGRWQSMLAQQPRGMPSNESPLEQQLHTYIRSNLALTESSRQVLGSLHAHKPGIHDSSFSLEGIHTTHTYISIFLFLFLFFFLHVKRLEKRLEKRPLMWSPIRFPFQASELTER